MASPPPSICRPPTLALTLVEGLGARIRDGRLRPGDQLPTEAAIRVEFGVSRTVVREAISKLQASGLVRTRHGVGTFVAEPGPAADDGAGFRIGQSQLATLHGVESVLALRIGIETEAAGLAGQRRSPAQLDMLRLALRSEPSAAPVVAGRHRD